MLKTDPSKGRGSWGSRLGFILAAAGSAVGLGNLWKFPYLTYKHGGGSTDKHGAGLFVVVYLIAVVVVGLPIMMSEILVGRRSGKNPVGAFEVLKPKTPWKGVGALGVITAFILLSYYAVVAGWTIEYTIKAFTNEFDGYDKGVTCEEVKKDLLDTFQTSDEAGPFLVSQGALGADALQAASDEERPSLVAEAWTTFATSKGYEAAVTPLETKLYANLLSKPGGADEEIAIKRGLYPSKLFTEFLGDPVKQIVYLFAFMLISVLVVIGGISGGIERFTKVLMPVLVSLLLVLLVRALTLDGAGEALVFMFEPDLAHLEPDLVLEALGQAFFSLSLGMGALITYGSYLSKKANIKTAAVAVTGMDTAIGLIAAIIIFSAIFTYDMTLSGSGTGNLFTTIPVIFQQMPGGFYLTVAFYLLVTFAALTSTISLLEVVVSYFVDNRGWSRGKATLVMGVAIFALGIPSALSFNVLSDVTVLGKTFFDLMDGFCANYSMPIGGLLLCIFVGWVLETKVKREELPGSPFAFGLWHTSIRFIAPLAVALVLVGILVFGITG